MSRQGEEIPVAGINYVKIMYLDTRKIEKVAIGSIGGVKDTIRIKTKKYWIENAKNDKLMIVILDCGASMADLLRNERALSKTNYRNETIPPPRMIESASEIDEPSPNNHQSHSKSSSISKKAPVVKKNELVKHGHLRDLIDKKKEELKEKTFQELFSAEMTDTQRSDSNFDLQDLPKDDNRVLEYLKEIKDALDSLTRRFDQSIVVKDSFEAELKLIKSQYEQILKKMAEKSNMASSNPGLMTELPSRETENGREVSLGRGVYLAGDKYDAVEFDAKRKGSSFVRNLAIALFGYDVLRASSVHGGVGLQKTVEPGTSNGGASEGEASKARPPLCPTKLLAIEDTYAWYMEHRLAMTPEEIAKGRAQVGPIIVRQITDLRTTDDQRERKRLCAAKHRLIKSQKGQCKKQGKKIEKDEGGKERTRAKFVSGKKNTIQDSGSSTNEEEFGKKSYKRIATAHEDSDDDLRENFEDVEDIDVADLSEPDSDGDGLDRNADPLKIPLVTREDEENAHHIDNSEKIDRNDENDSPFNECD